MYVFCIRICIYIGTITVWDRDQALVWFELKGRSNRISSVQFDNHRLVSDGTYSLIVIHNFDVPYGSSDEQFQYDVEYTPSEEEEEQQQGRQNGGKERNDDKKGTIITGETEGDKDANDNDDNNDGDNNDNKESNDDGRPSATS